VVWVQLLPLLLHPPCAPNPAATVVAAAPDSAGASASDPTPLLLPTPPHCCPRSCSRYARPLRSACPHFPPFVCPRARLCSSVPALAFSRSRSLLFARSVVLVYPLPPPLLPQLVVTVVLLPLWCSRSRCRCSRCCCRCACVRSCSLVPWFVCAHPVLAFCPVCGNITVKA
jgi:hypothetical protein